MGGSNGSSTTVQQNYDPQSSRRLAAVAERQQELQEKLFAYYQDVYQPYEQEAIDSARANLTAQGQLQAEALASQLELLPDKTELEQMTVREQIRELEANRTLRDAAREEQLREIERTSIVADKFYDEALKGVDVQERVNTATADVQQAFANAQQQAIRSGARYGVQPSASDFSERGVAQATAKAGAATLARRTAEQENFSRLQSAMAARGQGVANVSSVTSSGTIPYSTGGTNIAQTGTVTNPATTAASYGATAISGLSGLASQMQSQTTTTSGGGSGVLGGALAGASIGSAFGPYGAGIGAVGGAALSAFS